MASLMNSFLSMTKGFLATLQGTYENFIAFFRPPPPPPRSKILPPFLTVKTAITIVLVLVLILSTCFAIWFKKVFYPHFIHFSSQIIIINISRGNDRKQVQLQVSLPPVRTLDSHWKISRFFFHFCLIFALKNLREN
jgi:hypothetical protein